MVFFIPSNLRFQQQRQILDASLGFAGGVMIAASYWSLLAPAIETAASSGSYGANGEWTFIPVSIGIIFGAVFVYLADLALPQPNVESLVEGTSEKRRRKSTGLEDQPLQEMAQPLSSRKNQLRKRRPSSDKEEDLSPKAIASRSWRRILLLVLAITVHNFPEGLAVGVQFGAIPHVTDEDYHLNYAKSFQAARRLAWGIGLQNFPEGLAVSLPMLRLGYSPLKSFWYGQLSGMVEPLGGVLGAAAIQLAKPCLPYALAFAAGAMIYVVVQELIPESHASGNPRLASIGFMVGFIIMMSLDVALG